MNSKRQFALYTALSIFGITMILIGLTALPKTHIDSLVCLGLGIGILGQLFTARKQLDAVRWTGIVVSSFVAFILAAQAIIDNAHEAKLTSLNPHWCVSLAFFLVTAIYIFWTIPKEYRAMQKSLNEPPKLQAAANRQQ